MTLQKPPEPEGYRLFGPEPPYPDVPYSEWKTRIDRARELMAEENIDLLMLWSGSNNRYFTGFTSGHFDFPYPQPLVALIPVSDDPVVVAGEFFRMTVEAQSWIRDIRCQTEQHMDHAAENLPREIAQLVKEMGFGNANIGLEMGELGHMNIPRPLNEIQLLLDSLPDAKFVNGDKVIWGCRMIKSALEIERLIKAAAIHRQAFSAAVQGFRPGMTENDVGKLYLISAIENGAEQVDTAHIACGSMKQGMSDTRHHFDGMTIGKDDYLHLDCGLSYKGYWADMGRIINVGPMTAEFREYQDQVRRGLDAAYEAARPGIPVKELFRAFFEAGGVDTEPEMGGHGIGLDSHEPPVISAYSEMIIQPGMTFEIESWIHRGWRKQGGAGKFHYENLVIITERGCQPIIGLPEDIMQVAYPFE